MVDRKDDMDESSESLENSLLKNSNKVENTSEDKAFTNSNQEIENMELHHPHHITHKKKWSEYLLEFLMLFFAVFLGFLVENYREHYIEQERAVVLAKSLYHNLAFDTGKLGFTARLRNEAVLNNDSLIIELRKLKAIQNNARLRRFSVTLGNHLYFLPFSGTFEQIKNSGALRYFPDSISLALTAYEQSIKQNTLSQSLEQNYITTSVSPFLYANISFENISLSDTVKTFDPVLLAGLYPNNLHSEGSNHKTVEEPFLNIDPNFKTHLYTLTVQCLQHNKFLAWEYKSLQEQAVEIMHLLRKEYDLK